MATLVQDLVFQQGITFEFIVEVVGGPASLSGYTAQMQVRPFRASEEVLVNLATGGNGLTIDAGTRRITITIDEAVTREFDWQYPAVYDLELRGEDKEYRVMEGTATVSREVTRS